MCSTIEEFEEIGPRIPGCRAVEIQVDFKEEDNILWDRSAAFISHKRYHVQIREREGPSQGGTQKCEPRECSLSAPKF